MLIGECRFASLIADAMWPARTLSEVRGTMAVPPYPDTLENSSNPKQWWADHRPIIAQTAALGPIDPRQRFNSRWEVRYSFGNSSPVPPITYTLETKTRPATPTPPVGATATVTQLMTQYPNRPLTGSVWSKSATT